MNRCAFLALGLLLGAGSARGQTVALGNASDPAAPMLAGRVCHDRDGDETCAQDEPGVPGARILLSDGSWAVCDDEGRYHLRALPTRRVSRNLPGRVPGEEPSRIEVKLDLAALGGRMEAAGPERRIVELAPASLIAVDFPVRVRLEPAAVLQPLAPRGGEVREGDLFYTVRLRTRPGHRLWIGGDEVPVRPDGGAEAEVKLSLGGNSIAIVDLSPQGEWTLHRQSVTVLRRPRGDHLFIPEPARPLVRVGLPDLARAPASVVQVPVQAPAGTRVRVGTQEVVLGAAGVVSVPLKLDAGATAVPVAAVVPGEDPVVQMVELTARPPAVTAALLGLELGFDPRARTVALTGQGTATVQRRFGELELRSGVNLDTADLRSWLGPDGEDGQRPDPGLLVRPRWPLAFERALDPGLFPDVPGDDAQEGAWNPSGMRLWGTLRHPRFGSAEVGPFHTRESEGELGRYRRALFGGRLELRAPWQSSELGLQVYGAPELPPGLGPLPVPAHDVLSSTGGSLYFLHFGEVVPGSERLRVEIRDALTGVARESWELERARDYDIDYLTGRVLLARPLPIQRSFGAPLGTPFQSERVVLVADYATSQWQAQGTSALGARARGRWGEAQVSAGVAAENRAGGAGYRLYQAQARAPIGPLRLDAEVARSEGALFASGQGGGFALSDQGGLGFVAAPPANAAADGAHALSLRLGVGKPSSGLGLWARAIEPGYADSDHLASSALRQVGGEGALRLGRWELALRADHRSAPDPRDPFGPGEVLARDVAVRAAVPLGAFRLQAEAGGSSLSLAETPGGVPQEGGGARVGLHASWDVAPELSVEAGHLQRIVGFGTGPGARDDTFTSAGVGIRPAGDVALTARIGWGPEAGTQVQVGGERSDDGEVGYARWTAGVQGPFAGQMAAASGARQRVEGTELFVEDLLVQDFDGVRAGRAVGLGQDAGRGRFSARYERAQRLPLTGEPALLRDAVSARAALPVRVVQVGLLGEVRRESGDAAGRADLERWQVVGGLAAEARPTEWLGLAGRLLASQTRNQGLLEGRQIQGFLSGTLRLAPWVVFASYALVNEQPLGRTGRPLLVHLVSLRPALQLASRFRLASGVFAAFHRRESPAMVIAGSVRPSLRIAGGLETALEYARRSAAPRGERLDALRAEIGYRFEEMLGTAVGYNLYGFSGTGVAPALEGTSRVYLRVEVAY